MRELQNALLRSLLGFLSRNISRKEGSTQRSLTALRFGRDDKGKRGASRESTLLNGSLDLDRSFPPLTCRRQVVSPGWQRVKSGTNQLLSPVTLSQATNSGCPISARFWQMWDTAGLALKLVAAEGSTRGSSRVPHVRTSVPGPKTMGDPRFPTSRC
jgi:hypothetical protein